MRHDRIIDLFGGNSVLGKLVGRSDSAISRWRDNGIPPNHWPMLTRLARKLEIEDVTIDSLAAGHPTRGSDYRSKGRAAERVA
jgi:hypothetical protein